MKRRKIVGEFSESVIKGYLADKIYEKRGLTRQQYIDKCREIWEQVKYEPEYERKVIVDFSQPVTLNQLFGLDGLEVDFVDTALMKPIVHGFEAKTDVECVVLLAAPAPDIHGKMNLAKVSEMFRPASPKPEVESLEQELYFLALFDVLGFSTLVAEKGGEALLQTYQELIAKAVLNTNYTGFGRIKVGPNQYVGGGFYAPVNYTYFSDTIMLWTTRQFTHVSPFLAKCGDLICEALKIGMPLRGSICFGEAVMHKPSHTFLGSAMVEASDIEKNQRWIGATLGTGFMLNDVKEAVSETLVVPLFCEHFKSEMKLTFPYLTLDWVRRWRAKANPDLIATLEVMKAKAPEKNKPYYDNTIAFVKYSDLDDFEARGQFLRAMAYRVLNLARIKLDAMPPRLVVLKIINEIPHCGFVVTFPPESLEANPELRDLVEKNILFVKRLDYPKFIESLPDSCGTEFDLAASGVVLSIEKKDVEYLDIFNLDSNAPPAKRQLNVKIVE